MPLVGPVGITPEAKRLEVIERVAAHILQGLGNSSGGNDEVEREVMGRLSQEYGQPLDAEFDRNIGGFRFSVIDAATGMVINPIEGDEASNLNHRLEEITQQMVDETMIKS